MLDEACIIEKGDHPFVKHKSFIAYREARLLSFDQLKSLLPRLKMQKSVSPALLQRIRDGAANSTTMRMDDADVLFDQGLIDPLF